MQVEQAATPVDARSGDTTVRRIQPARGFVRLDLQEVWRFRELMFFLMWRDMKARYRQTVLGAIWALVRPFASMIIFTVIFGHVAGIKTGSSLPYALFVFPGLIVMNYFNSALNGATSSVLGNGAILTKAYFPRVYIPITAVVAPLIDFVLAGFVLAGVFVWYHRAPNWHIVFVPFFLAIAGMTALAVGLWLGALTVRYRDIPYLLPFATQTLMYATPVIYPTTLVPARYHWLLALNPLTGVATGTRWALVGGSGAPTPLYVVSSIAICLVLLACGFTYFRMREPSFADHI